jgi:hypothetical protein
MKCSVSQRFHNAPRLSELECASEADSGSASLEIPPPFPEPTASLIYTREAALGYSTFLGGQFVVECSYNVGINDNDIRLVSKQSDIYINRSINEESTMSWSFC